MLPGEEQGELFLCHRLVTAGLMSSLAHCCKSVGAEIAIISFHLPSPLCSVGGTRNGTVWFVLVFRQDINWETSENLITNGL